MQPFDFSREVETKIQVVALRRVRGNPPREYVGHVGIRLPFRKIRWLRRWGPWQRRKGHGLGYWIVKKHIWNTLRVATCNNQDRLLTWRLSPQLLTLDYSLLHYYMYIYIRYTCTHSYGFLDIKMSLTYTFIVCQFTPNYLTIWIVLSFISIHY